VAVASAGGLLLALEILAARLLAGWGTVAAGQALSVSRAAALAALVVAPAAVAGGLEFALALRAVPEGRFAGLYRAESWGAVAAGLAFTFIIVHVLEPLPAALAAGAAAAAAGYILLRPVAGWSRAIAAGGAAVSLLLAILPLEGPAERLCWRRLMPGYDLLEVRETPYGRAAALRRQGSSQVSLFHNGALVVSLEPGGAPPTATRVLADFCACLHPAPRSALVVGGGLGPFPEEFLRHGLAEVVAVEQDPALFDMSLRWFTKERAARIDRRAGDGRAIIRRDIATGSQDLIIVSAGEPDSATVNRFYTVEFFRECRRCLSQAGVLVVMLPTYGGGTDYTGEALAGRSAIIWRTLGEAFPEVRAAPVNGFLFGAAKEKGIVTFDPSQLGRRLAARPHAAPSVPVESGGAVASVPVPPEDYFAGIFGGVLEVRESLDGHRTQERIAALEAVLAATPAAVNRDEHPVAVAESLVLGAETSGAGDAAGRGPTLAAILRRWGPWTVALPLGAAAAAAIAIILTGLIVRRSARGTPTSDVGPSGRRSALLLAAFATGAFGMAFQVGLLAAYQNARGYVYQEIGGIAACFMAGLALGARLGERPTAGGRGRAVAGLAAMIVLAVAFPAAAGRLAAVGPGVLAAGGFWAFSLAAGFLDGAVLAALVACGRAAPGERLGGWAYGFDLAGSGLGALVCGAAWIPLVGLGGAMLATAGLVAAGLAAVLALRRAGPESAGARGAESV
jgi:spermidine synthase